MLLLRLWPISVIARVAASDKVDQEEDGANDRQEHPEEVELEAEDMTLIKETINDALVAGAYGQIVQVLEKEV